jgi:hypothetical protein
MEDRIEVVTDKPSAAPWEWRLSRDHDLLADRKLARIEYRREGARRWKRFFVLLDEKTTFEFVAERAETLIDKREKLPTGFLGEIGIERP